MSDRDKYSRKVSVAALLCVAGLLASSPPVFAHHAFAADFDVDKPVEIKGTVTKLALVNPHSWLYLDVKNADGTVSNWGFEFGAPFTLNEHGISKQTFPIGTEVTIKGYRSKSGENYGYAVTTTLADGRTFRTGGAQDAPVAPATR